MNKLFIVVYTADSLLKEHEHKGKEFKSTITAKNEDEARGVFNKSFPSCNIKDIYVED